MGRKSLKKEYAATAGREIISTRLKQQGHCPQQANRPTPLQAAAYSLRGLRAAAGAPRSGVRGSRGKEEAGGRRWPAPCALGRLREPPAGDVLSGVLGSRGEDDAQAYMPARASGERRCWLARLANATAPALSDHNG